MRHLSGGQRRRLDVALGIVGRPELLFLDEPTTGFDPEARRQFWDLIRDLNADGTTILLTTHYLEEAEQLADRVAVIARGRVLEVGDPADASGAATRRRPRSWLDRGRRRATRSDRHPHRRSSPSWPRASTARCPTSRYVRPTLEDTYLAMIGPFAAEEAP